MCNYNTTTTTPTSVTPTGCHWCSPQHHSVLGHHQPHTRCRAYPPAQHRLQGECGNELETFNAMVLGTCCAFVGLTLRLRLDERSERHTSLCLCDLSSPQPAAITPLLSVPPHFLARSLLGAGQWMSPTPRPSTLPSTTPTCQSQTQTWTHSCRCVRGGSFLC